MTARTTKPSQPEPDIDAAIRARILDRAMALTAIVAERLTTAASDLADDRPLAALGALDGVERELTAIRSVLLLLS